MKTIQRFREALDWLFLKLPFVRRAAWDADCHRKIRETCERLLDDEMTAEEFAARYGRVGDFDLR